MTISFRIILALVSIITCWFVLRKIRKTQMQIEDALYWILVSIGLVLLSIFPQIVTFFSDLIGVESDTNFVFLVMIFVVLIKLFFLSLNISQLKCKLKTLIQEQALKQHKDEKQ